MIGLEGMASSCAMDDSGWLIGEGGQALEWAAQRGGGVTEPGGVQRAFGCGVEGHGLVRTIGEGRMVGRDDPVGLFQP